MVRNTSKPTPGVGFSGVRTVRLVIGYEGTCYEGWQNQKKGKTIQELFEKALARILKEKTNLLSSSRTDSGVHAHGLVAHFCTSSALPDPKIQAALNFYLPKDVVVFSAKTVKPSFHARYGAKSKIYRYTIWNHPIRPLFEAPFALWHSGPLDLRAMRKAARHLIGKHDFAAYKDSGDDPKTTVRTLRRLTLRRHGAKLEIDLHGDGFLTHMARVIVGTLIEVGRGRFTADRTKIALLSKDRSQAGPTAKPHALALVKVYY